MAYAAARIFDASLGQMLWSRRTIFMGLVVGLPVLLAAVIRLLIEIGGAPVVRGRALDGSVLFALMMWAFFIRFCVPVLAVFYGTSLLADEVEDKTITYLFSRPIPRGAVLVGKYLAYLVCTIFVVLPSVVLVWLLVTPINGRLGSSVFDMVTDLGLLAAGLATYGALFALVGAVMKRPLVFGLVFVFGWEMLALAMPGTLKRLTVAFYLQGLVPQAMPSDSTLNMLQSLFVENLGATENLISMGVITIVCLWLGVRAVTKREYVLEQ